ncbi:MAG: Hsp20/alpha crystallin family protein [Myxococcales bacterium]|nr:Hsp20/alpha crystallin family protein [Myxococcales bacterium]
MLQASRSQERAPASPASEPTKDLAVLTPPVDIFESEDEFLVLADLPGVAPDGLSVRFEEDELRLEALRAAVGKEPAALLRRVFQLPETIDAASIDATLSGGVLRLSLPKLKRARPREIKITVG